MRAHLTTAKQSETREAYFSFVYRKLFQFPVFEEYKMSYSFNSKIRYSEVDCDGKLTWIKLLDYFQDASVFHSESLDVGVDYLAERNLAWVLNSWQICLNRMPKLAEEVCITTLPYELRGFFGRRNFVMETLDGERLAYANSIWTFFDLKNNRPTKITPEMDRYGIDEPIEMEHCERKLSLPENMQPLDLIPVTRHLLDTNGHVNNGRYVELALAYLPEDVSIREVRAEYKMQGMLGDTFYPWIGQDEEKITVMLANQEQKPYAIVQFLGNTNK